MKKSEGFTFYVLLYWNEMIVYQLSVISQITWPTKNLLLTNYLDQISQSIEKLNRNVERNVLNKVLVLKI